MNEIGVSHTKFFFFRSSNHALSARSRNRPFVRRFRH
jgi:hypothetical protein